MTLLTAVLPRLCVLVWIAAARHVVKQIFIGAMAPEDKHGVFKEVRAVCAKAVHNVGYFRLSAVLA